MECVETGEKGRKEKKGKQNFKVKESRINLGHECLYFDNQKF